ncbi:MAG TPA: dihydrolipoamide acetyltransferase family protein [Candidatus Dormibacteraeota bacterium]
MALTVTMPQLGESVTEGTIAKWLKQPGDPVAKYESIAEVITDKVNAEIPSPADGVMGELIAAEGEVVAVGRPICSIETEVAAAAAPAAAATPATPAPAPPPATPPAQASPPAPSPQPEAAPVPHPVAAAASNGGATAPAIHMTPAVRMLVREHDVDVSQIQGSGIGGRVTKKDVLEYVQRRDAGGAAPPEAPAAASPLAMPPSRVSASGAVPAAPASPAPSTAPAAGAPVAPAPSFAGEGDTVVPMSGVRRTIAEHMVRSVHTSPHAFVLVEVDMSAVSRIREREKAEFKRRYDVNLTFLPFVARAVCEALRRHPTLNATWSDEGVVLKHDINLGIAVALEDNLVVPVVRNADRLSLSGLATTMAELGERARGNHLKLDEIQGGTFTLNNTGALGAVLTEAIINQPQAAIMTMDLVVKRPVVVEGDHIAIRPIMNLGMSFDHRINDGLQATRFVRTVKDLLEGADERSGL